ncbi:MAG TPA: GGDEF domain-containing protein [Usitatibacteraceae bacterium]
MLDAYTIFILMIATSLLLAASLWVAVGPDFRGGLGRWTAALCVYALIFALFASRGPVPEALSIIAPNSLFPVAVSLQAAALLEFYGRRLGIWWHILPAFFVAVLFLLMLDSVATRMILSGTLFGGGMLALAVLTNRLHDGVKQSARWLMMGGFLLGAVALFARTLSAIIEPPDASGLLAPGLFQALSFFAGHTVLLTTSVGFLVLHKDRAEELAQRLAVTDPLTGTFNRRTFLELAEKEIARSRRAGSALSLVMLDLDHFKRINDQHGHVVGDSVLIRFAKIVQSCLRREDLLVRYGGEEFCVLLPDVALDGAVALAERIRQSVERTGFGGGGNPLRVTVSAGVARLGREDSDNIAHLLKRADEAMYGAKAAGRNQVLAYPENSTIAMLTRSQRVRALTPQPK